MRISFPLPSDEREHIYCIHCQAESVERRGEAEDMRFFCSSCGKTAPRAIVIRPDIVQWVDPDSGELWHESVYIFVRAPHDRFLFFKRTVYPLAVSIPAGHLDTHESPYEGAARELEEEAGFKVALTEVGTTDIEGECRRGADRHRAHVYKAVINDPSKLKLSGEGTDAVWLTLEEAQPLDLAGSIRYFIKLYEQQLLA